MCRRLKDRINGYFYIDSHKPILRPLSDLVKPCLEGGKIPIVELAKIHDENLPIPFKVSIETWRDSIMRQFGDDYFVEYINKTSNMGDLVYRFSYTSGIRRLA